MVSPAAPRSLPRLGDGPGWCASYFVRGPRHQAEGVKDAALGLGGRSADPGPPEAVQRLVPPDLRHRSGRTGIRLGRHREQDGVARSAATLADAFSRRVGVTAHGHSPVLLSTPAHRAVNPLLFPWTVPAKPGGRPIMLAPGLRPGPGTERSTRWRWSKRFVHGPIRATPHGYAGVGTAGPSDMRHASKGRCRIPAGCGGLHPNPQRGGSPFRAGPLTSHTGRACGRKPSENGDGAGGRGFGDPANDGRA